MAFLVKYEYDKGEEGEHTTLNLSAFPEIIRSIQVWFTGIEYKGKEGCVF